MKVKTITCSERGDREPASYDAMVVDKIIICAKCGLEVPATGNERHVVKP